jgi:two-component system, sensor histidine kinase and response regulator
VWPQDAALLARCAWALQLQDTPLIGANLRICRRRQQWLPSTAAIVGEACKRLSDKIAQSQAEIILPPDWRIAIGHPAWIEEVWSNYISNAIKYGGSPPRLQIGADDSRDGSIRFWVRDNGLGLNESQLAALFREFSRVTPSKAEGHGLGLSIVKRIVEKLGGQVGASSEHGHGSVFYFALPAAQITAT